MNAIRQYIMDDPINWKKDRDNLQNQRQLPPPEKAEDYLEDLEEETMIQTESEGDRDDAHISA